MQIGRMLSVVGVAASLAFASPASAKVVSAVWTCNSDGFLHVVITSDDGTVQEWITRACGPSIAIGHGFKLDFSDKTMVSPSGKTFLSSLEQGGTISKRRVPVREAGATPKQSGGTEAIQLNQADVGPRLAALLTSIAPDWRKEGQAPSKVFSIFDRWGTMITARGAQAFVPGDMGIIIPVNGDAGDERNAKQRCLDKHGIWRERPKGEWGCWTTAK